MSSREFVTTCWTNVLAAGNGDSSAGTAALAALAEAYWYPLYAFARRSGHSAADAEDLTQSFFAHVIKNHALAKASKERGRFRSFLLGSFKRHLHQHHRYASAQKRGGSLQPLPLDGEAADRRYAREPVDPTNPEDLFERRWAMMILEASLDRLRQEFAAKGRGAVWEKLQHCVDGESDHEPYAKLALDLGVSEGDVKVTVHRMRVRLRALVREQLSALVANAAELEEEFRHWARVLCRGS